MIDLLEKLYPVVLGSGTEGSAHAARQVEPSGHDDDETGKHEKDLHHVRPDHRFDAADGGVQRADAANDENGRGDAQAGHRFQRQ